MLADRLARHAIVVGVIASAGSAHGSPRSDPTEGRAVFTGAATASVTAIDVNPAAMGPTTIDEVYVATTAVLDQYGITPRTLDAAGNVGVLPHVSDAELTPGAQISGMAHLGPAVLGGSLRTPPGEIFPSGHPSLGYSVLSGGQRDYFATLAISLKAIDRVYIGASFGLVRNDLTLHYLRDTALINGTGPNGITSACGNAPCGIGNPAAAQTFDLNAHTKFGVAELSASFGALVQITKDIWVGAGFHLPPGLAVQSELDGNATITRAPRDGGGTIHGFSTINDSQPASVDAEVRARIATDLDLHVGGRWEDLSRLTSYDTRVYGFSVAAAGIPEWNERALGLRDDVAVWAGVEQADQGNTWRFGARIGYETAGVDAARTTPLTMAGAQYTVDVGAQWRVSPSIIFQLTYGLAYFPSITVTKSAFDPRSELNCIASGFNYATDGCSDVRNGYAEPTADGTYTRLQHAARLGFRYEFQ